MRASARTRLSSISPSVTVSRSMGRRDGFGVVCRRCERWNLTPLEERWEAIEDCERAFRATTLRVLRALETSWRNAEEIAAIADNLHFGFREG